MIKIELSFRNEHITVLELCGWMAIALYMYLFKLCAEKKSRVKDIVDSFWIIFPGAVVSGFSKMFPLFD